MDWVDLDTLIFASAVIAVFGVFVGSLAAVVAVIEARHRSAEQRHHAHELICESHRFLARYRAQVQGRSP